MSPLKFRSEKMLHKIFAGGTHFEFLIFLETKRLRLTIFSSWNSMNLHCYSDLLAAHVDSKHDRNPWHIGMAEKCRECNIYSDPFLYGGNEIYFYLLFLFHFNRPSHCAINRMWHLTVHRTPSSRFSSLISKSTFFFSKAKWNLNK